VGYDLHITRADHWVEGESAPIEINEWLTYVIGDSEMRLDNVAEAEVEDGFLQMQKTGIAVWIAYSGHGRNGNKAWFDYRDGNVVVKNPDKEIIGKMRKIAMAMKARVMGDDGETY
jgi:hypothetical protein